MTIVDPIELPAGSGKLAGIVPGSTPWPNTTSSTSTEPAVVVVLVVSLHPAPTTATAMATMMRTRHFNTGCLLLNLVAERECTAAAIYRRLLMDRIGSPMANTATVRMPGSARQSGMVEGAIEK
jgi:hypothetical protein